MSKHDEDNAFNVQTITRNKTSTKIKMRKTIKHAKRRQMNQSNSLHKSAIILNKKHL